LISAQQEGEGQVVVVSGEPGIGKSHLSVTTEISDQPPA